MRLLKLIVVIILFAAGTALYAWKTGDRVPAKPNDGFWYPGTISRLGSGSVDFKISFDNGETAVLPAHRIRAFNWNIGTRVQCKGKNMDAFSWGKIIRVAGNAISISYDGDKNEEHPLSACRSN